MKEKKDNRNFSLNQFLMSINLKKQYLKNLQNLKLLLSKTKESGNYHSIYPSLFRKNSVDLKEDAQLVTYIIVVKFSRSNTLVHVMDFKGNLKFFYSAGSVSYSGKNKRSRYLVFRDLYRILVSKLMFLKGKPIALHLTNVSYNKFWLIKKLRKRFFIVSTRIFSAYPHNGCRKRKVRRKKFKTRKK